MRNSKESTSDISAYIELYSEVKYYMTKLLVLLSFVWVCMITNSDLSYKLESTEESTCNTNVYSIEHNELSHRQENTKSWSPTTMSEGLPSVKSLH